MSRISTRAMAISAIVLFAITLWMIAAWLSDDSAGAYEGPGPVLRPAVNLTVTPTTEGLDIYVSDSVATPTLELEVSK